MVVFNIKTHSIFTPVHTKDGLAHQLAPKIKSLILGLLIEWESVGGRRSEGEFNSEKSKTFPVVEQEQANQTSERQTQQWNHSLADFLSSVLLV